MSATVGAGGENSEPKGRDDGNMMRQHHNAGSGPTPHEQQQQRFDSPEKKEIEVVMPNMDSNTGGTV